MPDGNDRDNDIETMPKAESWTSRGGVNSLPAAISWGRDIEIANDSSGSNIGQDTADISLLAPQMMQQQQQQETRLRRSFPQASSPFQKHMPDSRSGPWDGEERRQPMINREKDALEQLNDMLANNNDIFGRTPAPTDSPAVSAVSDYLTGPESRSVSDSEFDRRMDFMSAMGGGVSASLHLTESLIKRAVERGTTMVMDMPELVEAALAARVPVMSLFEDLLTFDPKNSLTIGRYSIFLTSDGRVILPVVVGSESALNALSAIDMSQQGVAGERDQGRVEK